MKRRLEQLPPVWLRAIAPGSIVSCLLIASWIFDWSHAFSLQSFGLLTAAWLGGLAWAFLSESGHPIDVDTTSQATDYGAKLHSIGIAIETLFAEEITSVRSDVQRAGSIVQEAVEGLNLSFHKLSAQAQRPQSDVGMAMQQSAAGSTCQAALASVESNRINDDIAQAVRCLQFEDIVIQSLSTADDHLLQLNELDTMMQRVLDLANRRNPAQLEQLKADMEAFVAARNKVGRKVVQDSMASGDIELF